MKLKFEKYLKWKIIKIVNYHLIKEKKKTKHINVYCYVYNEIAG